MPQIITAEKKAGLHVAIIMDGNGRWATRQGKPRFIGHQAGARGIRQLVQAATRLPISVLTLFAFSSDNWQRPPEEVNFLMRLFRTYLLEEVDNCRQNGIRLSVIGRRDRLDRILRQLIEQAETETAFGSNLHLRVAIDYSSRDSIMQAARKSATEGDVSRQNFSEYMAPDLSDRPDGGQVDLLIRTGGEKRLSDFLLWESAYAELYFTRTMWPDFTSRHLRRALNYYHARNRRFGRIPLAQAI